VTNLAMHQKSFALSTVGVHFFFTRELYDQVSTWYMTILRLPALITIWKHC